MFSTVLSPAARLVRTQFLGLLALVIVLTGGAAYAATAAKNSVTSKSIKNGTVQTIDLKNGAVTTEKITIDAVTGDQVKAGSIAGSDVTDNSLTGTDVNESTLGPVPTATNANQLGGVAAANYVKGSVYKREAATDAGTALGDGTFTKEMSCDAGDILLSGGPASLNATSVMVESFPAPGDINGWKVRVNKFGQTDNWTVGLLCLDSSS